MGTETPSKLQEKGVTEITTDTFANNVLESEIPVVVDFYADWCGPCRIVSPMMERLAGGLNGKVRFIKVNVDENVELAEKYQVMSIPTIIFFDQGKEEYRKIGAAPEEQYRRQISGILLNGRKS